MKSKVFGVAMLLAMVMVLVLLPSGAVYGQQSVLTPGIPNANRAFVYAYWYSHNGIPHPNNPGPWDSGVTHAGYPTGDGPWRDFDITVPGTHSFTFTLWGPGPYFIDDNTSIFLLKPRSPQDTALNVTLESITVNGVTRVSNERFWFGGSHWNNRAGTYFGGQVNWPTMGTVSGTPTLDMWSWDLPGVGTHIPVDAYGARAGRSEIMGDAGPGDVYVVTIRVGGPAAGSGTVNPDAGDINEDGVVNAADATMLRRYLSTPANLRDWFRQTFSFNSGNADVTGNQNLGEADLALLRAYLAAADPSTVPLGVQPLTPPPDPDPRNHPWLVAFTFDDGPHPVWTPMLLDLAQEFPCPRTGETPRFTFYVLGRNINSRTLPIVERMVREGHHVENHSWGHNYGAWAVGSPGWRSALEDFRLTNQVIYAATGRAPFSFRAPRFEFGAWGSVASDAASLGMGFHEATADSQDWRLAPQNLSQAVTMGGTLAQIVRSGGVGVGWGEFGGESAGTYPIANGGQDGFNHLFHDAGGDGPYARRHVVEALRILVPEMQAMGYGFVTVEQLHRFKGDPPPVPPAISGRTMHASRGIVRGNHQLYVPSN